LFTASVSEIKSEGSLVGPTLDCLLAFQFRDAKFGDRFFYETSEFPNNFTPEQLATIKNIKLSKVLCSSMKDTPLIQPFAFLASTLEKYDPYIYSYTNN
jgi:peroxidase